MIIIVCVYFEVRCGYLNNDYEELKKHKKICHNGILKIVFTVGKKYQTDKKVETSMMKPHALITPLNSDQPKQIQLAYLIHSPIQIIGHQAQTLCHFI